MVGQIDLGRGWEEAWTSVATFLPKLLGFLAILIIGYFVAKAIEKILDRVLEGVGFDRMVERGGIRRALEGSRYDASGILSRIVFYAAFLFVLQLAFGVFGPNPVSDLISAIVAYLPRLFVGILIVVVTAFVATAVREVIRAALGGLPYGQVVAAAATVLIWVLGLSAALNQLQIAPAVVNGLLYALLALLVGIGIVAIGGGGIRPMEERWRRALNRVDEEAPRVREEARGTGERVRQRTQAAREELDRTQDQGRPGAAA